MNDQPSGSAGAGAAALWASAVVVAALILTQAGRLTGNQASADVATSGALTVLTAAAGDSEDVVAIIDGQGETVYVYGVEQGRTVLLHQVYGLRDLFREGRGAAGSGGR